jgi:hypothetical protein
MNYFHSEDNEGTLDWGESVESQEEDRGRWRRRTLLCYSSQW